MRPRTFILIILIVIIGGGAAAFWFLNNAGDNNAVVQQGESSTGTGVETSVESLPAAEPGVPPPTPTPSVRFAQVVAARVDIPVGQRLTADVLEVKVRPDTNIALQGGYTYSDVEELVGQIAGTHIAEGQAILRPMIALNSADISSFGSDLSLYIEQGKVAIAFPLQLPDETTLESAQRSVAYAMRPGDFVDVMMSLSVVDVDPEFGTALPNCTYRVNMKSLLAGESFLLPAAVRGRLEFEPGINQVVEIVPGALPGSETGICETAAQPPIPRRVTQLTLQNLEVLWVGTWREQGELLKALQPTPAPVVASEVVGAVPVEAQQSPPAGSICISPITNQIIPCPVVRESGRPDMVILSMTSQDALVLKWALERGIKLDLALRAQGDTTIFITSSVSLPKLVNEGILFLPQPNLIDLEPRSDEVPRPTLPFASPVE